MYSRKRRRAAYASVSRTYDFCVYKNGALAATLPTRPILLYVRALPTVNRLSFEPLLRETGKGTVVIKDHIRIPTFTWFERIYG